MPIKAFFASLLIISAAYAAPKGEDSVTLVQKAWAKTKSYKASFKQVVTSKRMATKDESSGEVTVQKPGKIRWDIQSERKLQILNGNRLTQVQIPKRRKANVVEIYENIAGQIDTRSLSFLSGTEEFQKAYAISIIKENSKSATLKFVPKGNSGSDTYIAEFDKSGYLLRSLVTESPDSSAVTTFSAIQTNLPVSESLFEYKPAPTDVVTVNK